MHALSCQPLSCGDSRLDLLSNHDFPRFAGTHTDSVLTRNAAVFPFVNDGFPIVYQGQEHVSAT
jgi:alpha-amylase